MRSVFTAPTDKGLTLASILLPILPDADALLAPRIPYGHPIGHRGFTHSLFFAALVGLVTAALALRGKWASDHSFLKLAIFFTLITASHGHRRSASDRRNGGVVSGAEPLISIKGN